jgi:hypothetical protein
VDYQLDRTAGRAQRRTNTVLHGRHPRLNDLRAVNHLESTSSTYTTVPLLDFCSRVSCDERLCISVGPQWVVLRPPSHLMGHYLGITYCNMKPSIPFDRENPGRMPRRSLQQQQQHRRTLVLWSSRRLFTRPYSPLSSVTTSQARSAKL